MFSQSAARLAGLAGALFGWRPDEFWQATPMEFATVLKALMLDQQGVSAEMLAQLKEMFPDG